MKKIENEAKFFEMISEDVQSKTEFTVIDSNEDGVFEVDDSNEAHHTYFIPYEKSLASLAEILIRKYGYMDWLPAQVSFGHDFIEENDEIIPYTYLYVDYAGE